MKKLLFLALTMSAALGAAPAGPDVLLYGPSKPEMYKYAFPEGGSSVDSQEQGKNRQLVYSLKSDVWAGGGIGVDKLRLKDYVAEGALEMYVRGAKGGEKIDVGFVQAKGLDAKDLAFQILAPLNNYGKITTAWTKITIPLKDFPAEGSRWIESEQRRATGPFNWNRVSEFVVSREPGAPGKEVVAFANVRVVGSYNASAVASAKPKVAKPTGAVVFYDEKYASDGGGGYAYPTGPAKLEEVPGGHSGKLALKASLITTAWSGGGIYRSPLDLSGYKDKGVLELWAKGGKGGEEVYVGLVDKANGASVRLSANSYLPGGLKTDWQLIRVPLKDFPKTGSKWDEKQNKNLSFDFDWTKVGEVLFDNNGPQHDNGTVFFDDVAVKPAP
jgi:hypothetical protein